MKTFVSYPEKALPKPFPKLMSRVGNPATVVLANESQTSSTGYSAVRLVDCRGPIGTVFELILNMWEDFDGTISLSND